MSAVIKSVLFVCTGNSCRSIMAEGLFRKELESLGKSGITVRSAGIRAIDGFEPTAETVTVMKEEGVDVSDFRSKSVTEEIVNGSDLILVMEKGHKEDLAKRFPASASKTFLIKEYGLCPARPGAGGIPDPIGMSEDFYRDCMADIKKETERIAGII
jgi:protein-tyrosine-phosphatase